MKTKALIFLDVVLALLVLVVLIVPSRVEARPPEVTEVSPNWTYISFVSSDPLFGEMYKVSGTPSQNVDVIGAAILQWERSHSNREIVSVQIIYRIGTGGQTYVDGVSIYHKLASNK